MKKNLLFIICFLITQLSSAQTVEKEFVFRGPVKTMTLTKEDYSEPPQSLVSKFEYDKNGRKIKEISPNNYNVEWFYLNNTDEKPVFKKSYNTDNSLYESISVEERNTEGKPLFNGDLDNGNWRYYYIYNYSQNQTEELWFVDQEIYSRKVDQKIKIDEETIPSEFVPFKLDRLKSFGTDNKSFGFSDNRYDHTIQFHLLAKDNEKISVKFSYNGDDVYDAGKGYWNLYKDGREMEERYIYGAKEISDFGHRYTYDDNGRLMSDLYGYFDKMPNIYMQSRKYVYNEFGDLIQETEVGESGKPFVVKYIYTYDKNKNWTSRKSVYDDNSGSIIMRSFTYYEPDEAELKNSLTISKYKEYVKKLQNFKPLAEAQYKNYLRIKKEKEANPVKEVNYRNISSPNWRDFLPQRQVLDSVAFGDLNKDGLEDAVLVYQPEKLLKGERNKERTLRILLQQTDGKYKLEAESKGAVAFEDMNNVFFSGISIQKGILILEHDFIRGGCTHKYRYQNGGFYLIGARTSSGDASYSSSIDYNLSTGKYISERDTYDEKSENDKSTKKEGVFKLKTLPNIETYELFGLEVDGFNL